MVIAALTALVILGLWTLEQLELLPDGNIRTWLARAAILPVVLAAFTVPSALQRGIDWYVQRKTNEVMQQFEPTFKELIPVTTPRDN